jgi:glutamate racemase
MIEDNEVNERQIRDTIETVLSSNTDVIVLACTHYHWIRSLIEEVADGRARILDPSDAIVRRVKSLLETR